jgi:hypothetical protein
MSDSDDLPFRDDPDGPDKTGHEGAPRPHSSSSDGGHPRTPGPDGGHPHTPEAEQEKKRLFERAIPELLKRVVERAVESGASRLAEGPENLRNFVQDLRLPKEVLHYLYQQIDDTKNGLYRVVAKEIRDVLEQTQFADEITKVLTKLSFEIKTEIRFIPNDAGSKKADGEGDPADGSARSGTSGKLPKPEVVSQVSVKERGKDARRERRGDT